MGHTVQVENITLAETRESLMRDFENASSDFEDSRQVSGQKDLRFLAKWLTALDERKELAN